MGRRYAGRSGALTSAATTTLLILRRGASVADRPKIYEVEFACSSGVADAACQFGLQRTSDLASGGTTFTGIALNPSDPAALAIVEQGAFSLEPVYYSNKYLLRVSMNQQFTALWRASKKGELWCTNVNSEGIGIKYLATSGGAGYETQIKWEE